MAGGGGNKKRFQCSTDPSRQEILFFRALQGHSGRNPIDPSLQDDVLIPNSFFENIYHIGCAVNLYSITNSGLIAGGQKSGREKQTWKRHQDTVYWVEKQLAQRKGFKFYQTRSNAVILCDTLPAYCISKAIVMKSRKEIKDQKEYVSSTTTDDFLQR